MGYLHHAIQNAFDFGDDWIFSCRVMEVDPDEEMTGYPKVIKSKGEAPLQYPMDEDEEEEGDW